MLDIAFVDESDVHKAMELEEVSCIQYILSYYCIF